MKSKACAKRALALLLAVLLLFSLASCAGTSEEKTTVRMAVLKGPTGIGSVRLWERNDAGKSANRYEITLCGSPLEILAGVVGGQFDIAACPLNMASVLYNKTGGGVQMLAVNTLGTLWLLSADELAGLEELKGKTITAAGRGASPEFILNYILKENGLSDEVRVEYLPEHSAAAVLAAAAKKGDGKVFLLPEPFVTSALLKNPALRTSLDLSGEFKKLSGRELAMGCMVVGRAFAEEHPQAVETFLKEYKKSVAYTSKNLDETAELCEKCGVIPKADIAKQAIPRSAVTFRAGNDMRGIAEENLGILYEADPKSVGGKLPGSDFFYGAK